MQSEDDNRRNTAFEASKNEVTDTLKQGKHTATQALHDARDAIADKAGVYATEAKDAVTQQAEGVQRDIGANLTAFSGALRAAGDNLANNDQRTASQFVLDAASGLDRLSSALRDKPFKDVLGEMRSFGRDHTGALIAGSVLAGLALGRFLKSSAPDPDRTNATLSGGGDQFESDSQDGISVSKFGAHTSLPEPDIVPTNDRSKP